MRCPTYSEYCKPVTFAIPAPAPPCDSGPKACTHGAATDLVEHYLGRDLIRHSGTAAGIDEASTNTYYISNGSNVAPSDIVVVIHMPLLPVVWKGAAREICFFISLFSAFIFSTKYCVWQQMLSQHVIHSAVILEDFFRDLKLHGASRTPS